MAEPFINSLEIGAHLRKLREDQNLTEHDLCMRTGLSLFGIQKIESGNGINWGDLFLLARYFNKRIRIKLID